MLGTKMIEQKLGSFRCGLVLCKTDEWVHTWIDTLIASISCGKNCILICIQFLPSYAYELLVKMKDYVYKKYYESQSVLKGNKRMLRSNGRSLFLQEITAEPKKRKY
jgi:hypothetical protein